MTDTSIKYEQTQYWKSASIFPQLTILWNNRFSSASDSCFIRPRLVQAWFEIIRTEFKM